MNFWNFTEQFSRIVFVQSTRRKRKTLKRVLGIQFRFVTVTMDKYFGITPVWIGAKQAKITDMEKTVLDMLDRPDLCGGIVLVSQALREAVTEIDWNKLLIYLTRFPNSTVVKRLGFLLEHFTLQIPDGKKIINQCLKRLSTGTSLLEIQCKKVGKINSRWRLQINVQGF